MPYFASHIFQILHIVTTVTEVVIEDRIANTCKMSI